MNEDDLRTSTPLLDVLAKFAEQLLVASGIALLGALGGRVNGLTNSWELGSVSYSIGIVGSYLLMALGVVLSLRALLIAFGGIEAIGQTNSKFSKPVTVAAFFLLFAMTLVAGFQVWGLAHGVPLN